MRRAVGPRLNNGPERKDGEGEKGVNVAVYEVMEKAGRRQASRNWSIFMKRKGWKKIHPSIRLRLSEPFRGKEALTDHEKRPLQVQGCLKSTPKQRGGAEVTDSNVNRALAGLRRLFQFCRIQRLSGGKSFPKDFKERSLFTPKKKGKGIIFKEKHI